MTDQVFDDQQNALTRQTGVTGQLDCAQWRSVRQKGAQHANVAVATEQAREREAKMTLDGVIAHRRHRMSCGIWESKFSQKLVNLSIVKFTSKVLSHMRCAHHRRTWPGARFALQADAWHSLSIKGYRVTDAGRKAQS